MVVTYIIIAGVIGFAAAWILSLSRKPVSDNRLEQELRQQVVLKDAEITGLREKLTKESSELAEVKKEIELKANWYAEHTKEAKESQEKAIADLRVAFKAMSSDALKENSPEFLRLANETFLKFQEAAKGDLEQRKESIVGLLKPLEATLKTYQERLQQSESSQSNALGEVKKHLETLNKQSESLAHETMQFRMVLTSNQARGRWGEETLRRVVEAAGMSIHCDFSEQSVSDDKKPDMIVHLPGERMIIVDAKVPDLDFITALDTSDLEKRSTLLLEHARKLKDTIRNLGAKNYPAQFQNALDYVVLFLPAESLFSAALEGDRELITWAAKNRIMIATPASLIALLRSVSISWQQSEETENARAIAATARELYKRVATFVAHFEKIRAGLTNANNAFNDAVGSYERMVRPSGERLLELGLGTDGKEMGEIKQVEGMLRLEK